MLIIVEHCTELNSGLLTNVSFGNTGTIGHVAHGKSTVVKAISGVHTVRFKNELERNITIKLGYANAKVSHYCKCSTYVANILQGECKLTAN